MGDPFPLKFGLPSSDLDEAVDTVGRHWDGIDGMNLFFTGGTGFVGTWMCAVLAHAVDQGRLKAKVRLLSRDPARFASRARELGNHPAIRCVEGDVTKSGWNCDGATHLVAGATEASASLLKERPRAMLETIVDGTSRSLDRAEAAGVSRALFISSGAANGPQPPDLALTKESDHFGLDPFSPRNAYAEGKRFAELLFTLHKQASFSFTSARLWAFVGPLLPLDAHFAVGNFLADVLANRVVRILGDGTTIRSYQYASEMAAWNWILLASGRHANAYNVGSSEPVSTRRLADLCTRLGAGPGFEVLGTPDPARPIDAYVPSTVKFRSEFGRENQVPLETALARTLRWNRSVMALETSPAHPYPVDPA